MRHRPPPPPTFAASLSHRMQLHIYIYLFVCLYSCTSLQDPRLHADMFFCSHRRRKALWGVTGALRTSQHHGSSMGTHIPSFETTERPTDSSTKLDAEPSVSKSRAPPTRLKARSVAPTSSKAAPYTPFQISHLFAVGQKTADARPRAATSPMRRITTRLRRCEAAAAGEHRLRDDSRRNGPRTSTGGISAQSLPSLPLSADSASATVRAVPVTDTSTTTASSSPSSKAGSPPSRAALTVAFLQKVATALDSKRIPWHSLVEHFPEIGRLPIYSECHNWTEQFMDAHRANPVVAPPAAAEDVTAADTAAPPRSPPPPVFLCAAGTGAGKSVLVPLYALDAHWRTLQQRLRATIDLVAAADPHVCAPESSASIGHDRGTTAFDVSSKTAFVKDFQRCSRVCIIVSQPTRVAAVELARYIARLLDVAKSSPAPSPEARAPPRSSHHEKPVGKRVGYAVGGHVHFGPEAEIIFATPGYIVNALQGSGGRPSLGAHGAAPGLVSGWSLRPTTIVVDEAHCRELETDLLLAFLKRHRAVSCDARSATRIEARPAQSVAPPSWATIALRQIVVMSATMQAERMFRYFGGQRRPPAAERRGSPLEEDPTTTERSLGPPSQSSSLLPEPVWLTSVLQRTAAATSVAAPSILHEQTPYARAHLEAQATATYVTQRHPTVDTGGGPHRIERYFLSDLTTTFLQSDVLFGPFLRQHGRHMNSSSPSGGVMTAVAPSGTPTPLLLTADGRKLFSALTHFFSYNASSLPLSLSGSILYPQGNAVAQLVLLLLQALHGRERLGSTGATAPHRSAADSVVPTTILVFLPGFAEIQTVLQCIERQCVPVDSRPDTAVGGAADRDRRLPDLRGGGESVAVLRYGQQVFSVALLHTAAVGDPQHQLAQSALCGAPLRVVLATAVAESSLTIPQVTAVVDLGLERKFTADPISGTMCKYTTLVDRSSLRQRCGRTGRTCDGVVIHLVPQSVMALPPAGLSRYPQLADVAAATTATARAHGSDDVDAHGESSAVSPSCAFLRAKSLFADRTAEVMAAMPCPYTVLAMESAYRLLVDAELLAEPAVAPTAAPPLSTGVGGGCDEVLVPQYPPDLRERLNSSSLTPKGQVVSALPIPLEQGLLVYHALQFACVEDAILIACAMTVPSLFLTPRIDQQSVTAGMSAPSSLSSGDSRGVPEDGSPLEQYDKILSRQRHLAGCSRPEDRQQESERSEGGTAVASKHNGGSLSEPLVLRALMLQWYLCITNEDMYRFLQSHGINRNAIRMVDTSVAQCCHRLVQLLMADATAEEADAAGGNSGGAVSMDEDGVRVTNEADTHDFYSFHRAVGSSAVQPFHDGPVHDNGLARNRCPPPTPPPALLDPSWPPAYRRHLIKSLQRLRLTATSRAVHRSSAPSTFRLTQWFTAEPAVANIFAAHYAPTTTVSCAKGQHRREPWAVPDHPTLAKVYDGLREKTEALVAEELRGGRTVPKSVLLSPLQRQEVKDRGASIARRALWTHELRYDLGALEDRLCAAFVAAFARFTMRGEDAGYRRHHTRMRRNWSVVDQDELSTCSFDVDLRPVTPNAPLAPSSAVAAAPDVRAALWRRLTPDRLRAALEPYLRGAGLRQVEMFAAGRTAVARFTRPGTPAALTSPTGPQTDESVAALTEGVAPWQPRGADHPPQTAVRTTPAAAPSFATPAHERTAAGRSVRLAPFGVSLLVAAQHALQRIAVELPASAAPPVMTEAAAGHCVNQAASPGRPGTAAPPRPPATPPPGTWSTTFTAPSTATASTDDICWRDRLGAVCRVRRTDIAALGLGNLLPTPATDGIVTRHVQVDQDDGKMSSRPAEESALASDVAVPNRRQSPSGDNNDDDALLGTPPTTALVSVRAPIHVTRGIHWRVRLPSHAWLASQRQQQQHRDAPTSWEAGIAARPEAPTTGASARSNEQSPTALYCVVCQHLCINRSQFREHCTRPLHLARLAEAVRLGISASFWRDVGGGHARVPLAQLSCSSSTDLVMGTELHTCRVSHLSYLNVLQAVQSPNGDELHSNPLAVAGSLMSSAAGQLHPTSTTPQRHPVGAAVDGATEEELLARYSTPRLLTAQHVWVLNLGAPFDQRATPGMSSSASPTTSEASGSLAPPPLLALAGYLAASSQQYPTAFLFDAGHTHVHGIMLHGGGSVWRLPTPLRTAELDVLQRVLDGRGWPGVLRATRQHTPSTAADGDHRAPNAVYEGTHWCVAAPTCPLCTVEASRQRTATGTAAASADPVASLPTTVAATLLLTLQEYMQARRQHVSLSEYVERVVAKLQTFTPGPSPSPVTSPTLPATEPARERTGVGATHLASYLQHERRGQSLQGLLQDLGCQFTAPPPALALWAPHRVVVSSPLPLHNASRGTSEGTTLLVQFTLPPVLPSRMPAPDFGVQLRYHNGRRHRSRGVALSAAAICGSLVDARAAPGRLNLEQF